VSHFTARKGFAQMLIDMAWYECLTAISLSEGSIQVAPRPGAGHYKAYKTIQGFFHTPMQIVCVEEM